MNHSSNHIFEMDPGQLREFVTAHGLRSFRAEQILNWVYHRTVGDPSAMSNLSNADRRMIEQTLPIRTGDLIRCQRASDGTQKLLIGWRPPADPTDPRAETDSDASIQEKSTRNNNLPLSVLTKTKARLAKTEFDSDSDRPMTECVMIPAGENENRRPRRTACISSQVGCPVRCKFCASGLGGLEGNLSAGRIVEQVWRLNEMLKDEARNPEVAPRITNVVFMGMGEPLSNYNAVIKAVRILNAPWALNISARKITISTVGLPAGIRRLAREQLPVTLALSLHAPNDAIRRELIPWAEYAAIDELMDACREYFQMTGREITFEYTLMRNVNDRPEHAQQLAKIVRTVRGNVNLIRYNEVGGVAFQRPRDDDVHEFQGILRSKKVNAHIRASRGRDISAACGQLRHEEGRLQVNSQRGEK